MRGESLSQLARATEVKPPPVWMRVLVAIAFINTPLIALGAAMMAHDLWMTTEKWSLELFIGVPTALLIGMLLAIARRQRVSRWQRAVVVVVLMQMLILPATSFLLAEIGKSIDVPPAPPRLAAGVVVAIGILTVVWAKMSSRGSEVPRAVRAFASFSMTFSLVFAFMLPFAARLAVNVGSGNEWSSRTDGLSVAPLLGVSALPSIAVAVWVGVSDRKVSPLVMRSMIGLVGVVVALDTMVMPRMRSDGWTAYIIGVHSLLACYSVALATMGALAFMHWWAVRDVGKCPKVDPPSVIKGTVEADAPQSEDGIVGWFRYLGALRGMRAELGAFWLRSDENESRLMIPAGSSFLAALPAEALDPTPGDRIPALRVGDTVIVRGFVAQSDAGFREHAGLVPGLKGLRVLRVDEELLEETGAFQEVVLAIWRPFVIGLAVATAGSIPIVIALVIGLLTF